ncbi:MAG: c-type cytochrome [Croceibacterium sp.]
MNFAAKGATALVLVVALSACGGGSEQAADTSVDTSSAMSAATPAASAAATPAPTASAAPTPSASASAAPTPKPTPTPSASAKPVPVAAVKPADFAQCSACHSTEPGKNGIGPSLAGIYGDKAGTVPGYDFSDAMKSSGLVWNQASLDRYLTDPKGVVPGTKMGFPGLKDAAKRQAVIAYLKSL